MLKKNVFKILKIGDRILAVNGQDVRNATQEQAINLIKNAGCTIELDIQSFDLTGVMNKTKMNKTVDVKKEKTPYADTVRSELNKPKSNKNPVLPALKFNSFSLSFSMKR